MTATPAQLLKVLEAIAREEGFYRIGTRPQRNNNPGDLEFTAFARSHGATHGDPRFAVFPSALAGIAAMRALLNVPAIFDKTGKLIDGYLGATVSQALNRWAPPVENATNSYIANVCLWTGLTPTTVLTAANIG
jgi:hypothetical protein